MVLWWCVIHRCFDDWPASIFFTLCAYILFFWNGLGLSLYKKKTYTPGRCILAVVLFVVKLNASRCRQLVVCVIGIHSIEVWLRLGNFSHGSTVKKFASVFSVSMIDTLIEIQSCLILTPPSQFVILCFPQKTSRWVARCLCGFLWVRWSNGQMPVEMTLGI